MKKYIHCYKAVGYTTLTQYEDWNFDPQKRDWESLELGEELTGYIPPPELLEFLNVNVNLELQ